jgi:hypothetical protein
MAHGNNHQQWDRAELHSLLSAAANLAGLCITVVALLNTFDKAQSAVSIVDDLFGICAAIFLLCIYLIFWALRGQNAAFTHALTRTVDVLFLVALSAMTVGAFMMIYTIW